MNSNDERSLPAVPDAAEGGGSMQVWAEELVARARQAGVELVGEGGLLTGLVRD